MSAALALPAVRVLVSARLRLALVAATLAVVAPTSAASAQWQTRDGDLWAARRCQARNLISGGLVLSTVALPLLRDEERAPAGLGVLLGGVAVASTGIGLRGRLGSDPGGRVGPHDAWPEERCQARSMSIRGGLYLTTAIATAIRILRLPDDVGTPRTRAIVALLTVVPPGLIGLVFTALGLRRLRQLGSRPEASALDASGAPTLLLELPLPF